MAARERSEIRREQIIDAALRVVAEDGLGRFTTAAIAKVVGVTDAALFRHFESKEAIVLAAIDRIERVLFADFPPRYEDPLERLGAFFLARVRAVSALPGVADVMFSEQLAQAAGGEGVRRVRAMQLRTVSFLQDCLAEAAQAGRLREDADVDDLFVLVRGALLALLHPDARKGNERVRQARADRVWTLLEGTLTGNRRTR
jgi:AcrR family transcriptional regulator